jgi:hypothetical protein
MTLSNNDREKIQAAMNQVLFTIILDHWKEGEGVRLFNAEEGGVLVETVELGDDFASGKN